MAYQKPFLFYFPEQWTGEPNCVIVGCPGLIFQRVSGPPIPRAIEGIVVLQQISKNQGENMTEEAVKSTILEPITTVIIPEWEGLLEPSSVFRQQNIELQNKFNSLVLPMLEPVRLVLQSRLTISRLIAEIGDDVEIQSELPANHLVEWYHPVLLIFRQANGEKGPLLTNGGANIFFLLVGGIKYAISFRWYLHERAWDVAEWLADENDWWEIGDQVFTLSLDH